MCRRTCLPVRWRMEREMKTHNERVLLHFQRTTKWKQLLSIFTWKLTCFERNSLLFFGNDDWKAVNFVCAGEWNVIKWIGIVFYSAEWKNFWRRFFLKVFPSILNLCPSFRVLNPWNQYSKPSKLKNKCLLLSHTSYLLPHTSLNKSHTTFPKIQNLTVLIPLPSSQTQMREVFSVRANAEGTFGKFLRSHGNVRALKKCFGRFFSLFRCLLFVIMLVRLFSLLSCLLN